MAIKPPGGASAHEDRFARERLPDPSLWPEFDFSGVPELGRIPDRLNAAAELLDRNVALGNGGRPVLHLEGTTWSYDQLLARANQIAGVLSRIADCEPAGGCCCGRPTRRCWWPAGSRF